MIKKKYRYAYRFSGVIITTHALTVDNVITCVGLPINKPRPKDHGHDLIKAKLTRIKVPR